MEVFTLVLCCLCLIVSIVIVIVLRQIIKDINNVDDRINLVRARIVDSFNEVKNDMRFESEVIQIKLDTYLSGDKYESYEPTEEINEENKDN